MPALQKQAQAAESELQSWEMAAVDEAKYLDTLEIAVRQQILRLGVKELLVGANTITLRHSTPEAAAARIGCPT